MKLRHRKRALFFTHFSLFGRQIPDAGLTRFKKVGKKGQKRRSFDNTETWFYFFTMLVG